MEIDRARGVPGAWASRGAIASLVLAYVSEVFSRDLGVDALVLGGYVLAAVIFAVSDRSTGGDESGAAVRLRAGAGLRSRATSLAAACVVAAIGLDILAYRVIYDSLRPARASVIGPLLWVASLAVLLAVAAVARPLPSWPAAWRAGPLPRSLRLRRAFIVALVLVIVGAAVARLIELDRVPWGINADEGDRGASAMSLLSGAEPRNLFASGWFYISNVYFFLLAGVLKVLGVGFAQARVLGAVCSILTLCVIVWIALRHFGARVALLAAIIGATLGVSLQFARETTEATPTALLWALSVAFLLEAARSGGTWPWVASGVSGGLSLYFYPSGRLWVAFAVLVSIYLILRAGKGRRLAVAGGVAAMALGAILTLGPFVANARAIPGQLLLRASQTSVLSDDNASRLNYYNPHWNKVQLLWAQLRHSFAIFANAGDGGAFWPTDRPILGTALTVLVAVGLGWFTLSWLHTPRFTLALWFWIGFGGMVVTVDTPDLQRMATSVPVLPLLAAVVIDATAARLVGWTRAGVPRIGRPAAAVAGVATVAVAATLAGQQAHFYFGTYADMYRWPQPTLQGQAVADQGPNALVTTLGLDAMQINSGWVRLLAPHVDRGAVGSPGTLLPLPLPATRDLAFALYPQQSEYLPYLRSLYPGGSVHYYKYVTEGIVVIVYRVPRVRVAAQAGSLATPDSGKRVRVAALGDVPAGVRRGSEVRWSAELYVPSYWDYSLRLTHGPAILRIDGKSVLALPAHRVEATTTVALARGRHFVTLDGVAPRLEWRVPPESAPYSPPSGFASWQPIATSNLVPAVAAHGLLATVSGDGVPSEERLDGSIADCCLTNDVSSGGRPFVVHWTGMLRAPASGRYALALFTQGLATLEVDGRAVIRSPSPADSLKRVLLRLHAGRHAIDLRYQVAQSGGAIELTWTPPGGVEHVIPPAAFEPPPGAGVGPPVSPKTLTADGNQPVDVPVVVIR